MTYRDTARAFSAAETSTATDPNGWNRRRSAADALPLSEWSETRRDILSPQTVAANHALHVSGAAHDLREAIAAHDRAARANGGYYADDQTDERERVAGMEVSDAARSLLAAIGEAGE